MKTQTNNLVIAREIRFGAQHVPSTQNAVCVFSLDGMNWELPVDPTRAIQRTVVNRGAYRSRVHMVIDP